MIVDANVQGGLLKHTSRLAHTKLLGNSAVEFRRDVLLVEGSGCVSNPQQEFCDETGDSSQGTALTWSATSSPKQLYPSTSNVPSH